MAVDKDFGENAKISYSITGEGSEYFSVDPWTGALYTTFNLGEEVCFCGYEK